MDVNGIEKFMKKSMNKVKMDTIPYSTEYDVKEIEEIKYVPFMFFLSLLIHYTISRTLLNFFEKNLLSSRKLTVLYYLCSKSFNEGGCKKFN